MGILARIPSAGEALQASPADHLSAVKAGILQHMAGLRIFARHLTANRDRAEDLVQDAILRALAAADQFTPGTNFHAWIFMILRNLFYNELRRPWLGHVPLHELASDEPAIPSTQEQCLEFCDFRRAFARLAPVQRDTMILVCIDGLSYAEAALRCRCSVGTVKSRVSRGRRNLQALLATGDAIGSRGAFRAIAGSDIVVALGAAPLVGARAGPACQVVYTS